MSYVDEAGNEWFGADHQCPGCFPPETADGWHCDECDRFFPTLGEFDRHRHPGGLVRSDRS